MLRLAILVQPAPPHEHGQRLTVSSRLCRTLWRSVDKLFCSGQPVDETIAGRRRVFC